MAELGDGPVHVHSIVDARVSAFLYRYRRERLGLDEERARADMEKRWRRGGAWAAFIGGADRVALPHGPPHEAS